MTLVSIVGDFYSSVLPVFYEFHTKITNHVIVYDDYRADVLKAKQIIAGTRAFTEKNSLGINTYTLQIDEDSIESIEKIENYLYALEQNKEDIYINATDGLANIPLYLAHKMLPQGVRFISYDRFDNSYNLLTQEYMHTHRIKNSLDIATHFLLKNINIEAQSSKQTAKEYEKDLFNIFYNYQGDVPRYLEQANKTSAYLQQTQVGFLYEFYIYNLLKDLNHDDISIGVKVDESCTTTSGMHNEFDILIMKENHLHMIECKFRKQLPMVDLVYKMDSVRTVLDDESKIIILTNEEFYNKQTDAPNFHITPLHKRANAKKIYMRGSPRHNIARFIREVDQIFKLKTKNIEKIIQKIDRKN